MLRKCFLDSDSHCKNIGFGFRQNKLNILFFCTLLGFMAISQNNKYSSYILQKKSSVDQKIFCLVSRVKELELSMLEKYIDIIQTK